MLGGITIGNAQKPHAKHRASKWASRSRRGRDERGIEDGTYIPPPAHNRQMPCPTYGHAHRSAHTGYKRIGGKVYEIRSCDCGYTERKAVI